MGVCLFHLSMKVSVVLGFQIFIPQTQLLEGVLVQDVYGTDLVHQRSNDIVAMDAHDDDQRQLFFGNLIYFLAVGDPNNGIFFDTFVVGSAVCAIINSAIFLLVFPFESSLGVANPPIISTRKI